MQCIVIVGVLLLDAAAVAIQHLEHGQRLALGGQLGRHLVRRHQRHERVIARVILAAERAGIGERRRGDERLELRARFQFVDEQRQQLIGRRLLHERHERLELAKSQPLAYLVGNARHHSQVECRRRTQAGNQHPPANVFQELTTTATVHDTSPCASR